jgi:hypothetical protein
VPGVLVVPTVLSMARVAASTVVGVRLPGCLLRHLLFRVLGVARLHRLVVRMRVVVMMCCSLVVVVLRHGRGGW